MGKRDMRNIHKDIKLAFKKRQENDFIFYIDENFIAFEGHFPNAPVLPGIVQIEIGLFCIRQMLQNDKVNIEKIRKSKFAKLILPKSEIIVSVSGGNKKYSITIKDEKEIYSQIQLICS